MESTTGIGSKFSFTLELAQSDQPVKEENLQHKRKFSRNSPIISHSNKKKEARRVILSVDDEPVNQVFESRLAF